VITLDAERMRRGRISFAHIATKALKHELHHVTLAMMRRRRMGEDEQFHFRLAAGDIRFMRRMNFEIVNCKS
jgi:hypothetical protein